MPKSDESPSYRRSADSILAEPSALGRKKGPAASSLRPPTASPDFYAAAAQQAAKPVDSAPAEPRRPGRPKKKVEPPPPVPPAAAAAETKPKSSAAFVPCPAQSSVLAKLAKLPTEEPAYEVNPRTDPFCPIDDLSSPPADLDDLKEMKLKALAQVVREFTPSQLERYETFRRSAFNRLSIKRYMHNITGGPVGDRATIVMAGIAKVYVGQLVEQALVVMHERGQTGKLRPEHLREARRRLQNTAALPWRPVSAQRPLLRRWR